MTRPTLDELIDAEQETEEQEHGPDDASYLGGPGEPYYQARILCWCGWSTGRQETWEECGRMFDEHLASSERRV